MISLQPTPPRAPVPAPVRTRVSFADLGPEPFRLLFPAGVLAGLLGVALWPLQLNGWLAAYPGPAHARIMTFGLFGGFILGFAGTVLPRMTSTMPFRSVEVVLLTVLHLAAVVAHAMGARFVGDLLFAAVLALFIGLAIPRIRNRRSMPPPGFVLVGLAFACVVGGVLLSLVSSLVVLGPFWLELQRLLLYQGFVLLPILGVGPFILPGLFGVDASNHFGADMLVPGGWARRARFALAAGVVILLSFIIEAAGWPRSGNALRAATLLLFLARELPIHRGPLRAGSLAAMVRVAIVTLLAGYVTVALFPGHRVGLLHLSLMGGFAVITFVVGARVGFGHSGRGAAFMQRQRWLVAAVCLMMLGLLGRLLGHFQIEMMPTYYTVGALLWLGGTLLWCAFVLPRMLVPGGQ